MVTPPSLDLRQLPDAFYEDPYPTYDALRATSPVYALPGGGYFVTQHELAHSVYRDSQTYSSDKKTQFATVFGETSRLFEHHTTALVFRDPPLHTNVRRAIGNALSQRMVEVMQSSLEEIVDNLITHLAQKGAGDLVSEFASAIPVEVIGNLLGIPTDERGPLRAWSFAILKPLEVDVSDEQLKQGEQAIAEFLEYLARLIDRRAGHLEDQDDILARLIKWRHKGEGLTPTELYHQCIFLLNAGHETTTNLIGNGIELFCRFPEELHKLRDDPTLIDRAVEEVLRYESSNQLGNRTTLKATELGGVTIPADEIVTICIGAANRDPAVFAEPHKFDIKRTHNPHLGFGAGIHTCAGLNVARQEGRVALSKLYQRFQQVTLTSTPQRDRRARFRGFLRLDARLD